jgi:beta-N-acetylhexosaminidase
MKAIADRYGPCDAARRAKAAGADVILPLGPLDEQIGVVDAMCATVEAGELPLSVFEATVRRLDTLRNAYNFSHELPPFAEPGQILYDRALEEAYARADSLSGLVSRAFPQMRSLTVGAEPTDEDVNRALELLHDAEAVLLITRNVVLSPQRTRFVQAIGTVSIPVIHVAVGLPYDAGLVTNAAITILTYGDPDVSLTALLDVLTGKVTAHGISPITLNVPRKDATS